MEASTPGIGLEQFWNCYALEEVEQRKKLWLDIFLCRVTDDEDFRNFLQFARKRIVPHLIVELKVEIGVYCGSTLAPEDLEQLKTYIYGGRGWKILRVLDIILSTPTPSDQPFIKDEDSKEFVDVLISLYQLSVFPHHQCQGKSKPSENKDTVSALDLWHETLMTVASNEHERTHEAPIEAGLAYNLGKNLPRTLGLWQHLAEEAKNAERKFPNVMTKGQRKKATRTLLRGFSSSAKPKNFHVSNLFAFERRFSACSKMSSDSESVEVDDLQRSQPPLYSLPKIKNPMDFEFFMSVVRSDDEATGQSNWLRLRTKLSTAPVTPSVAMEEVRRKSAEVDVEKYLELNHEKLRVLKLTEVQLSTIVTHLMCTICNVEIRWKLRQRKVQLPSPPCTLYNMSFPLVQFACDTLANPKLTSCCLQVNLVTLLLTGLADVVIFGDIESIIELFFHHRCLEKCLEVVRRNGTWSNHQVQVQLLSTLIRVFRVTLEKHANHKELQRSAASGRSRKEEIVKHVCSWFSRDKGLAQTIVASALLNVQVLRSCQDDLLSTLLEEIGRVVAICGLCGGTGNGTAEYPQYLKETRASLAYLFSEVIRLSPVIAAHSSRNVIEGIVDCMSQSVCVAPHLASATALALLQWTSQPLDWLHDVIHHSYARHNLTEELAVIIDESDSAICASDSSTSPKDYLEMERRVSQKRIWTPYLEWLLKTRDVQALPVRSHLNKIINGLPSMLGLGHIWDGIVWPILETDLSNMADDDLQDHLIWALRALVKLHRVSFNPSISELPVEKYRLVVNQLVSFVTSPGNFHTEIGYAAYQALGCFAAWECSFLSQHHSDEVFPTTESTAIMAMIDHLSHQKSVKHEDLALWLIQKELIESFSNFYSPCFSAKGLFELFHEMNIVDVVRNRELYLVSLQVLASHDVASRDALIDKLLDHVETLPKPLEARKTIVGLLVDTSCHQRWRFDWLDSDNYSDHFNCDDDADNEDEDLSEDNHWLLSNLIDVTPLQKILNYLGGSQERVEESVLEFFLGRLSRLFGSASGAPQEDAKILSELELGKNVLGFLRGIKKPSESLLQLTRDVCRFSIEYAGEAVTKDYIRALLDLLRNPEESDLIVSVAEILNLLLVKSRWNASQTPQAYATFPLLIEDFDDPWATTFQLPSNMNKFAVSLWLAVNDNRCSRPSQILSIGNSDASFELLLADKSVAVSVVAQDNLIGSTKFEPLYSTQDQQWCQLTLNYSLDIVDTLQIEMFIDGDLKRRENITLRSLSFEDLRTLKIGSVRKDASDFVSWDYAQLWMFSRKVTKEESLALYLAGPSIEEKPEKLTTLRPRAALLKRIADPTILVRVDMESTLNQLLSSSTWVRHLAGHDEIVVWQNTRPTSRGLLSTLLQRKSMPEADQQLVIKATKSFQIPTIDLMTGSWCDAILANGGVSLLILILAKIVENGGSDRAVSLALNALLTASEETISDGESLDRLLLKKILSSCNPCQAGLFTLKVLLEHSMTEIVLDYDEGRDIFCLPSSISLSSSVVFNGANLTLILDCWPLWRDAETQFNEESLTCSEMMLSCLQTLLLDTHLYRDVNVETLRKLAIIQKLAFILKTDQYSPSTVPMFIDIFSALVGSPPNLDVIGQLIEATLFLHESTFTYIHHAKHCFYFVLPPSSTSASSMTWPRPASSSSASASKRLPKSASFSTNHQQRKEEGLKGVLNRQEGTSSQDNAVKLDPQRLQKVLRSNKRTTSFHLRKLTSTNSHQQEGLHFGHLSRLENMVSYHQDETDEAMEDTDDLSDQCNVTSTPPKSVIEGLLQILSGALLNMPDVDLNKLVTSVLLPEHILTLINHPDALTRLAGVQLLTKYVERTANNRNLEQLGKIHGFQLLACQLHSWGCRGVDPAVVDKLVTTLVSVVHGGLEVTCITALPELPMRGAKVRAEALPPLLAMLPLMAAAGNQHLATLHALIVHLHDIMARVQNFVKTEYERLGLFEVICKTLQALLTSPRKWWSSDIYGQDSRDVLFQDLDFLLRFIGMHFASAAGSESFRILELLLSMLLHMVHLYDANDEVNAGFRQPTINILGDSINDLVDRIQRHDKTKTEPVHRIVLTTDVAVGGGNGEEVTELLMRSLVDDHFDQCRNPRHFSASSEDSFSFRADALRSHSHQLSEGIRPASRSDLADRLQRLVHMSCDLCWSSPLEHLPQDFIMLLMSHLMGQLQSAKPALMRSTCQPELMRLYLLVMHPDVPYADQVSFLKRLHACFPNFQRQFHQLMTSQESSVPELVALYRFFSASLAAKYKQDEENDDALSFLMETLELTSELQQQQKESLMEKFGCEVNRKRSAFYRRTEASMSQVFRSHEEKMNAITAMAIEGTATAMAAQDSWRKQHLFHLRDQMATDIFARQKLASLVARLTHERGPWPFKNDNTGWRLDEIEGSHRMRIRLCPARKTLDSRFYRSSEQDNKEGKPFQGLLKSPRKSSMTGLAEVLVAQMSRHESTSVKTMEPCWLVIPAGEVPGELLLTDVSLHFVQQGEIRPQPLYMEDNLPLTVSIRLDDIVQVLPRWYQLNDCALEFFLEDGGGISRLVAFSNGKQRDGVLSRLVSLRPHWSSSEESRGRTLSHYTQQWQDGLISNFEYLMQLNKLAGRTFSDLMQYPIFPFVLADYVGEGLDLRSAKSFRDLRKPISVQRGEKEEGYRANYRALADELQKSHEMTCPGIGPYHYGSHYSNAGIVLHFMVRVSPFTAIFLKYQDGSFDIPDRTFHDVDATWKLASGNSTTDVKELIPELFYLPEMLRNEQGLQLGHRQGGQMVDHVQLPPWAQNDPRRFIKIHRQALESDYVGENLHHWIDLIFGYKQKGQRAVEAINVFHPATYYGFDINTIEDPVQRQARATMIRTYGQTPKQLFDRPHPMRQLQLSPKNDEDDESTVLTDSTVSGLKWGQAVKITTVVYTDKLVPLNLVAVGQDRVIGLPLGQVCLVQYNKDPIPAGACTIGLYRGWAVAWLKKAEKPRPLLRLEHEVGDRVVRLATTPGLCTVWVGYASGKLTAFNLHFETKSLQLEVEKVRWAWGHQAAINDIAPSRQWSVVVTASEDGTTIVWDTRKLTYVRTLEEAAGSVNRLVKVSATSGDIAAVTQHSDLSLFTINGSLVGRQTHVEPPITALAFSHQEEGRSINVIATGHQRTGVIRLWSTWDLSPLRDVITERPSSSLDSLVFSADSRYIYASFNDGYLVILERSPATWRPPNFLDLSQSFK